ncbi:hypothetical protein KCP74_23630 [Salmonella enterica subsp. enterica]|nr:hypothetical protein KCP74_23630 [Salmonella enterica subsp. enterica]
MVPDWLSRLEYRFTYSRCAYAAGAAGRGWRSLSYRYPTGEGSASGSTAVPFLSPILLRRANGRTGVPEMWRAGWIPAQNTGRSDDQLVPGGQRIELGEIDRVMQTLPMLNRRHMPGVFNQAAATGGDARQLVGYLRRTRFAAGFTGAAGKYAKTSRAYGAG